MLKKRTSSHQKHQIQMEADSSHGNGSFFSIPGLFIGLSNKGLSDYDSAWSPTSPLDFKVFPSFSNPFARCPISSAQNGNQKGWESGKVGLSIVDSLDDNTKPFGKVIRSSDGNILFGPRMLIRSPKCQNNNKMVHEPKPVAKECPVVVQLFAKSLIQKDDKPVVVFEIGDCPTEKVESLEQGKIRSCSLDSYRKFPAHLGSSDRRTSLSLGDMCLSNNAPAITSPRAHFVAYPPNLSRSPLKQSSGSFGSSNSGFVESLSASEIELSEDYTRVISHGPNPKTTHFFGDLVLESLDNNSFKTSFANKEEKGNSIVPPALTKPANMYHSDNFLSFCCSCHKELEEGKDIYMYRGEKGFCSDECRSQEILMEEEMEEEEGGGESQSKNSEEVTRTVVSSSQNNDCLISAVWFP